MRRLSRNHWRLGWILAVNGIAVVLQLTGPIRTYHDQQLLHQAMRTATPAFSYWKDLFGDPWTPILAGILLAGMVAEVFRNALSPVLNLAPLGFWLILTLRDPFYGAQLLIVVPLALVIAIHLAFYSCAFRGRRRDGGSMGSPSPV